MDTHRKSGGGDLSAIQRHDVLIIQRDPENPIHSKIAASLRSESVHTAYAISATRAAEMHFTGLRTVEIRSYKRFRVMRPATELLPTLETSFKRNWLFYRWQRYGYWQGFCQIVRRWAGVQLPFYKDDNSNCSEFTVAIIRGGMMLLYRLAEIFSAPADYYDPPRMEDALHITPLYRDLGIVETQKSAVTQR